MSATVDVVAQLRSAARGRPARVVLPESDDPRVLEAAHVLAREGIVTALLLGHADAVREAARTAGFELDPRVAILDPAAAEQREALVDDLCAAARKPLSRDSAQQLVGNRLLAAVALVGAGRIDACVAGAVHATRDVLRAGLDFVGLAHGATLVSSVFLMVLPGGRAVTFGDCAVVPDPTAPQLADIAIQAATTHRRLTGEVPYVAMLSFSTNGSATHDRVRKVREAVALARAADSALAIDGELQFDAAWEPAVARRKAADSHVAGHANVFIFPDLDAGNIGYKIAERLGSAHAIGPILQGLARPVHDLSRGCKSEDIVTLAAIAALQAASPA